MEISKTTFDALTYFKEMAERNKLVINNSFHVGFCSGPQDVDAVMAEYRDYANFILIEDTTSANTFGAKPGFFDRKVYAIHIIAGYEYGNDTDFKTKLELCRTIFKQMLSKVITDKAQFTYGKAMMYLNLESIYSQEYGRYSFNGATGLFFQLQNSEPLNLIYDANEWED